MQLNNLSQAITHCQIALKLNKEDEQTALWLEETSRLLCLQGEKCLDEGKYEEAITIFTDLVKLGYETAEIRYNGGLAYYMADENYNAIRYLQ